MEIINIKKRENKDLLIINNLNLKKMEIIDGKEPQVQQVNPQPVQPELPRKEPMSVGQWVLTLFLLCIPIVDIVLLFVWAFGGNKDERTNWAKAQLIWLLIGIAITFIFLACTGVAIFGAAALSD